MSGFALSDRAVWLLPRARVALVLLLVPLFVCAAEETGSDAQVQSLYRQAQEAEGAGDISTAIRKYQEIVRLAPKLGAAYNNLGALYFRQREYDKAADVLEKGLKVDPTMPTASALLGIAMSQLGRYREARPYLEAALRRNPRDNQAAKVLAQDLIKLHDLEGAAARLRQITERQPQDQEAWYLLGEVYVQLSQQALAKMNAIDPNSELVHEKSGEIMESMKNYDGALLEYHKAAKLAPQKPGIHYKLANVYWTLSQFDAANKECAAELANDPHNCRAQALVGDILIDQQMKFDEALVAVDKALEICPDLTPGRIDRGRALLKLHRNQEAAQELERAARASPEDSSAHFFLAQAYRALGRARDAQSEIEIYSKLEAGARAATAEHAQEVIEDKEAPQ